MRLCSVASGSSGNCIYAGTDTTHLLVDVGISGKRTEAGLNELGVSMRDIDGILVTHEHSDHIAGLGVLAENTAHPFMQRTERSGQFRIRRLWGKFLMSCFILSAQMKKL